MGTSVLPEKLIPRTVCEPSTEDDLIEKGGTTYPGWICPVTHVTFCPLVLSWVLTLRKGRSYQCPRTFAKMIQTVKGGTIRHFGRAWQFDALELLFIVLVGIIIGHVKA